MTPPTLLTLVHSDAGPASYDAGDRVTSDGVWSLTHQLGEDEEGDTVIRVVATHLATGLQLTHPAAGIDDWLMSGLALGELIAQAVSTLTGIASDEDKLTARAALIQVGHLLPAAAVEQVEYRCECGGYLALAPGRRLVHVDVCGQDISPTPTWRCLDDTVVAVVCDPAAHTVCLEPAARSCGHGQCHALACAYAPPCEVGNEDCCGCCTGRI